MANAIYPKYKEALLTGAANAILTGSGPTGLYVVLIDTDVYTYSPSHQFHTDLAGFVSGEQEVNSVTVVNGVIKGNNVVFPLVPGTTTVEALIFFRKNAGPNTTWRLVAFEDTSVPGLPVTTNGGDINVAWNAAGIFSL